MYNLNKAFSFHIELTDKCNARCVQCERNEILKDGTLQENPKLLQTEITIDQFKAIFENYHKQARYIVFCGNFGDPMFAKDILEITEHCITKVLSPTKEFGITQGLKYFTNGGYKPKEWWSAFAKVVNSVNHQVVFAIDGLADTHHLYRVNTRFERVIENAKAFIEGGGNAQWSFIRFGHNQHQEEQARKLAKELGFKSFTACNSERFKDKKEIKYTWNGEESSILRYRPVYKKEKKFKNIDQLKKQIKTDLSYSSISSIHKKSPDEANMILQNNAEKWKQDPEAVRMESVRQIDCFTEHKNEIYIDSKGYVYPCCWIGSYEYEKMSGMEDEYWNPQIDGRELHSAFYKDFRDILKEDWFEYTLPESWDNDPCQICSRHCGKNVIKTIRQTQKI